MKRIQRQRTRGWRMPEGAVYVGRPTRWGNPWRVDSNIGQALLWDAASVVDLYRADVTTREDVWAGWTLSAFLDPLRDATALVCWCPLVDAEGRPVPCHADVLIELLGAS